MLSPWHSPGFRELLSRFAPVRAHTAAVDERPPKKRHADEAPNAAVSQKKAKKPVCKGGGVFPMEVWAKIIQRLPHVAHLIPLAAVNSSLRSAIW